MTVPCRGVARLVEAYLDEVLTPAQLLEVENHAQECAFCRERIALAQAMRGSMRRSARAHVVPSGALRERVAMSMAAERRFAGARAEMDTMMSARQPLRWRTSLALAAAAAAMIPFGMGAWPVGRAPSAAAAPSAGAMSASVVGFDKLIDDFVDWHARPLPPEVTNPNDLPAFEPYVGVPVHPPRLAIFGAHLLGGRILPVHEMQAAAMLQYTLQSGHRVSVYVYDPHRVHVMPSRLTPRVMGDEPVYVGHVRGYSVAAAEHSGVGYAVASDLGDDESAELALATAPAP